MLFLTHFWAMLTFSVSLKTPENIWFSRVFRGYKMGTLGKQERHKKNISGRHHGAFIVNL